MRISKIDRQFLKRWIGVGFIVAIGLTLETRLSLPDHLLGLASGFLGFVLQYLLLRKYFENARFFILIGVIWVILGFLVNPVVESVSNNNSQIFQIPISIISFLTYSVVSILLLSTVQAQILRREFEQVYLWIVGNLAAWITMLTISFFVIQVMARSPVYTYLPNELFRLIDPISLVSNVLSLGIFYLITGSTLSIIINSPKNTMETI